MSFGVTQGRVSLATYETPVGPWIGHLSSLSFSFLIYKIEIIQRHIPLGVHSVHRVQNR